MHLSLGKIIPKFAAMLLSCVLAAPMATAPAWGAGVDAPLETTSRKERKQQVSYALGVEVARTLKRQRIEVDAEQVVRGLTDVLQGNELLLKDEELLTAMNGMAAELRQKQARERLIAAQDNRKEGEEYLARNRTEEGVVTLPSGLQYRILKAGTGRVPADADTIEYGYRGMLIDGTPVDNTYLTGSTIRMKLGEAPMIAGLREALKLMPAGSSWRVFLPHQLAFGSQGTGRQIGPNAALIYDLDLLGCEPSAVGETIGR